MNIGMLLQLLFHFIQSNESNGSTSVCNTSSFYLTQMTNIKKTRPINITFLNPSDRCDVFYSESKHINHIISPECIVLSSQLVYPQKLYEQSNIFEFNIVKNGSSFYVYAYNCTQTIQGPDSISISWTRDDAASVFPLLVFILGMLLLGAILLTFIGYSGKEMMMINMSVYCMLFATATVIITVQEIMYLESIVEYQKANLVIWAVMNSLILSHVLLFIVGFKSTFKNYKTDHIIGISLVRLLSLALNLFNSLSYFYFDLNKFLLISIICIPITVLIELVPFIILWVRLSLELEEVCRELCSKKLYNSNYDVDHIYCYFHSHNIIGLSLILIQSLTPMYVYFYNLNANACSIVSFFTHLIIPAIGIVALSFLVSNIGHNFDEYAREIQFLPIDDQQETDDIQEANRAYSMAITSYNMASIAYQISNAAFSALNVTRSVNSSRRNEASTDSTLSSPSNFDANPSSTKVAGEDNNLAFQIEYSLEDNLIP